MIIQHRHREDLHTFAIQGTSNAEEMRVLISQLIQLMQPIPGKTIQLSLDCRAFDGVCQGQEDFRIRVEFETLKQ